MDLLGNTVREYLRQKRADNVRTARTLADEFRKEGMTNDEVAEMLCASGYEEDVIHEAISIGK
jgi:hypothetical protein